MVGTFLYSARAVYPTMMVALDTLAVAQSEVAEDTNESVAHLLYYCATNPDYKLIFHASNMTLHIHRNASYLSELHVRSRAGGHF